MTIRAGQHRPLYAQEQIVCIRYLQSARSALREALNSKSKAKKAHAKLVEAELSEYLSELEAALKSKDLMAAVGPTA